MMVKDCMRSDVVYVSVPGTREDVLQLMAEKQINGVPVVKKGTKSLVGIVTRTDLLQKADENQLAMLMVRDPETVTPKTNIKTALKLMIEKNYRRLPVVENDELVGLVSVPDILGATLEKEKAGIALKLFKLYEFPKQVEQLLSDYNEAGLELERTKARARSQLSQAKAKLASAEATLGLRKERLDKVNKQLEACIIKAPAPGQVVYSSSTERWSRVKIEQGAEVPRGYKIIEIPDTSKMKVEIKVHEVWIDKIQVDQEAKILVSAFPDKTFTGKVLKKAPLADPQNWLNEELKVYATDVGIDGTHDFLKTGMTGKVEVIIDELHDVLYIPIQSVVTEEETKICYVKTNKGTEKRVVETGLFNDDFIEIKSGLTEGEMVLLNPPRWIVSETKEEETKEEETKEEETKEETVTQVNHKQD